jgi:hypothetical protein
MGRGFGPASEKNAAGVLPRGSDFCLVVETIDDRLLAGLATKLIGEFHGCLMAAVEAPGLCSRVQRVPTLPQVEYVDVVMGTPK